eukprot:3933940-Rhodomonas_salina.1
MHRATPGSTGRLLGANHRAHQWRKMQHRLQWFKKKCCKGIVSKFGSQNLKFEIPKNWTVGREKWSRVRVRTHSRENPAKRKKKM